MAGIADVTGIADAAGLTVTAAVAVSVVEDWRSEQPEPQLVP
ncbi:hypothetical protein [Streptomyces sp. NPDC058739]